MHDQDEGSPPWRSSAVCIWDLPGTNGSPGSTNPGYALPLRGFYVFEKRPYLFSFTKSETYLLLRCVRSLDSQRGNMLDPLSALSLAANVAQFVELGAVILARAKEIGDKGSTVKIAHLSVITSDLVSIDANLRAQIDAHAVQDAQLTNEEEVSPIRLSLYRG